MTYILQLKEKGALHLPAELLGQIGSDARFVLKVQGDTLILYPEKSPPFWVTVTIAERIHAFRQWSNKEREIPAIPLEKLCRENIYH